MISFYVFNTLIKVIKNLDKHKKSFLNYMLFFKKRLSLKKRKTVRNYGFNN